MNSKMKPVHDISKSCSTPAADLRQTLEASGWRYTPQRAAVFSYLCAVDDHPTAEDIYQAVRRQMPRISLATVYKALEALADAGVIAKLADAEGPARFD